MIGSSLDKYEVLQKIGEGGMATVYRGRHATLDREVAIKVLHPHLSSSTRNRKRFAREARAIEHLRHPNILEIHDYSGVDTSDCYIITEFVPGDTLTVLMDRCRRLPSELAAVIGLALAEALAYAHDQGILHRDLKPDNVMIRSDGVVKLMDFGIARFLDESHVTLTGALVGSPAFMSPEQAREEELDARSDLFSLGTLLFFLVTGHLPFAGSNPSLILKNIIEGHRAQVPDLAPTASAVLSDVIERLLATRREERFADAHQVVVALQECLDEVGFDPCESRWQLSRYLVDPDAVDAELQVFLGTALLDRGRERLHRGDHLVGLRLINRLLSLQEDHPEALALLQSFHGVAQEPEGRRRWLGRSAAAVLLVTFGGLAARWISLATAPTEAEAPPEAVATLTQAPTAVASAVQLVAEAPAPPPPPAPSLPPPVPVAHEGGDAVVAAAAPVSTTPRRSPRRTPPPEVASSGTAEAPPPPPEPACIAFRTREAAEVWLDGELLRSTRVPGCHELPAGEYTFVIRGSMVKEKSVTVTLKPGEERSREWVALERLPARITFPRADGTCLVLVDGATRGTVDNLGGGVEIVQSDAPHDVELDCGPRGRFRHHYPELLWRERPFEGQAVP